MEEKIASVVIPTLSRYRLLERRLPIIASAGFDEIIVVDSTQHRVEVDATRNLCDRVSAAYVNVRAGRSEARNIGARIAQGRWLFFCDDDGYVITLVKKEVIRELTNDADFMTLTGHLAWVFRREFFLRLGGYNETLVAGEDDDLTRRARAAGKEVAAEGVIEGKIYALDPSEQKWDRWRRMRNQLEYGLTMIAFAMAHPSPRSVVRATARKAVRLLSSKSEERRGIRFCSTLLLGLGVILSPLYFAVHLQSLSRRRKSRGLFPDERS